MEIVGKIIFVGTLQQGTSARTGNTWQSQDYTLETQAPYPRRCCFNVFGADKIRSFNLHVGDVVKVYLSINAHEYNGRWFNEISGWKVER